jgi:hypothetical protein
MARQEVAVLHVEGWIRTTGEEPAKAGVGVTEPERKRSGRGK